MNKNIRRGLNQLLKRFIYDNDDRQALMEFFDNTRNVNSLLQKLDYYSNTYGYIENQAKKYLDDYIVGEEEKLAVYPTLFYANPNLLFSILNKEYEDKVTFYIDMRDRYQIDLEAYVKKEIDRFGEKGYNKLYGNITLKKNPLWDLVDLENILKDLTNNNSKLSIYTYLLLNFPGKGLKHLKGFNQVFLEFAKGIISNGINTGKTNERDSLIKLLEMNKRVSSDEIYKQIFPYGIDMGYRGNNYIAANIVQNIITAGYNYSQQVKNFTQILVINDYVYGSEFHPLTGLYKKQQVDEFEFASKYYGEIKTHSVYFLDYLLRFKISNRRKEWASRYIKERLSVREVDGKTIYTPTTQGKADLDNIFSLLRPFQKFNFNTIYRSIVGSSYDNLIISDFESLYREFLTDYKVDYDEIDRVLAYFNGEDNFDMLSDYDNKSNRYNNFSYRNQALLSEVEKDNFEYYKRIIKYEVVKGHNQIYDIIGNTVWNTPFSQLEKYGLNEAEMIYQAFILLDSYRSIKTIPYLKKLDEEKLEFYAKKHLKDLSFEGKKTLFEETLNSVAGFQLLLDNVGSSKALKEVLVKKAKSIGSVPAITMLKEGLKGKKVGERRIAIEVLMGMDNASTKEVIIRHKEVEKNKKLLEDIEIYLNGKGDKKVEVKGKEGLLSLLTSGNKRSLKKFEHLFVTLKDKDGNELAMEYTQLLPSFYLNYPIDKAYGHMKKAMEFIDIENIGELAHNLYSYFRTNNYNNKEKLLGLFGASFLPSNYVHLIKEDIEYLSKNSKGVMATYLLEALSYNSDETVLSYLDYAYNKIKHKQVKEGAKKALESAAKARNITLEELKDLIIPSFDLDIRGEKTYSYGERVFKVSLLSQGQFEIYDIERDKILKNLPKERKDEDAELVKAIKKEFSALKKKIKGNYKMQVERLETSLALSRHWNYKKFNKVFVENPVMREFATSLVWAQYTDGSITNTFRISEDGSYIDAESDDIEINEDSNFALLHPIEIQEDLLELWSEHLEDYEVVQPFEQIKRKTYKNLIDYKLSTVKSASLNFKLLKLGWERGAVLDGGVFYNFYLRNSQDNIGVELRHEGIPVGWYDDQEVSIEDIKFFSLDNDIYKNYDYEGIKDEFRLDIKEVPARFLSEVVYQLEGIIAKVEG